MKFLWLPAMALVATVSLPALAQEAPPQDGPRPAIDAAMARPSMQQMEAMQKVHEQLRQIHTTARLQMLGSLSPAHRAALANIIGQLAIAPTPNRRAAEAQIDALLSNGEKSSVLGIEANARTTSRSLMTNEREQMEASATPDERAKLQARDAARAQRESQGRARQAIAETPDAGRTLLRLSEMGGFGGGPEDGRMGRRMGDAPPPPGAPAPGAPN